MTPLGIGGPPRVWSHLLVWTIAGVLGSAPVCAAPPPGADPNSPEAAWYRGADTQDCASCCDIADGRPVQARPDTTSPLGWAVFLDGTWVAIPVGTRATRCGTRDGATTWGTLGDYPAHPAGHAVVWIFQGQIRCFSPPGSGT